MAFQVFVNLVGGLRLMDTALDLAVAAVVMSSYASIPISPDGQWQSRHLTGAM